MAMPAPRGYKILREFEESNDRFRLRIRKLKIQMVPEDGRDPMSWLKSTFEDMTTKAMSGFSDTDQVRITFEMKNANLDVESSPFRPKSKWQYTDLWELISKSTKSIKQFSLNEPFVLIIQCVEIPTENPASSNPTCNSNSTDLECPDCGHAFWAEEIMRKRRRTGSFGQSQTVCGMLHYLQNWAQLIDHPWKTRFCETCDCKRPFKHECFMAPRKPIYPSTNYIFIFYDFEPEQKRQIFGETSIDPPKLCVAQQVCTKCLSLSGIPKICQFCGPTREKIFKINPVEELVEFATQGVRDGWRVICIAYNASDDGNTRLILPHLGEGNSKPPQLTFKNVMIDRLETEYQNFVESERHLALDSSKLSKVFEIWEDKLSDSRFNADRRNLEAEEQLIRKCKSRVDTFRRASIAFRKMFLECCKMCPFTDNETIPASCIDAFRQNYLRPDTIAILPPNGYKYDGRYSQKAIKWLDWKEHELGVNFTRDKNGSREFVIPEMGRSVDAYGEIRGKRYVFEFHSCYWHGCRCISTYFPVTEEEINKRSQETRFKTARLKELGYVVEEIRECEFDRLRGEDEEMHNFLEPRSSDRESSNDKPLEPRDAMYDGRVENISRYYNISLNAEGIAEEKIRYYDIRSLYPYIYKYGKFPVGHPKVYVGDQCKKLTGANGNDITNVEGLIKCLVLPPRNLYFPVLPVRMHGEQMYPLCRKCCEKFEQDDCPHNDEDRQFEGTWVSEELKKAVKKGYKIVNVLEIWQYAKSQIEKFNPKTGKGGLFVDYTNAFFKIKQEASDWPTNISREEYLDLHEEKEGIRLDPDRISNNPGLRHTAKYCLNAFWGKLGQRENLPKARKVETRQDLLQLLSDPEITVTELLPVNDQLLYATWSSTKGEVVPLKTANVVIAAYVTAQARLELYKYLEKLDRQVLYCNTDCVIYVQRTNEPADELKTGYLLGEMKDELAKHGPDSYIEAFVSVGLKTFMYKVRPSEGDVIEDGKVKGMTLNHSPGTEIDFESLRKTVFGEKAQIQLDYYPDCKNIPQEEPMHGQANTTELIFKRRRFVDNFGTLPYGYREENN